MSVPRAAMVVMATCALLRGVDAQATPLVRATPNKLTMIEGEKLIDVVTINLGEFTNSGVEVYFTSEDAGILLIQEGDVAVWGPGEWRQDRFFTLYAVNDRVETGDREVIVTVTMVQSNDTKYENWPLANFDLTVSIKEDDDAAAVLTATEDTFSEAGGGAGKVTVMLSQEPKNDVVGLVEVVPGDYASASPQRVVVTPEVWNDPDRAPVVEIFGKEDIQVLGDTTVTVRVTFEQDPAVVGDIPVFDGVVGEVQLTRTDNDVAGLVIQDRPGGGIVETEEARPARAGVFFMKLASEPLVPVTITLEVPEAPARAATEGRPRDSRTIIVPSRWNTWTEMGVLGLDDDEQDGDVRYRIRLVTESEDAAYDFTRTGCCEDTSVEVVNRDDDGYTQIRVKITATRLSLEIPDAEEPAIDLNEVRFRTSAGEDVDLSRSRASCFANAEHGTTDGGTAQPTSCPVLCQGCGPASAINDDLKKEWRTKGYSTLQIDFDKPKTLCSHSFNWGSGQESANPYRWEISARTGDQNAWRVLFTQSGTVARGDPNEATRWWDWCPVRDEDKAKYYDPWRTLIPQTTYVPGYPTPMPTTAAPPTPEPRSPTWTPEEMTPEERVDAGVIGADGSVPPDSPAAKAAEAEADDDSASVLWIIITVLLILSLLGLCLWWFIFRKKSVTLRTEAQNREAALLGVPTPQTPPNKPPSYVAPPVPPLYAPAEPVVSGVYPEYGPYTSPAYNPEGYGEIYPSDPQRGYGYGYDGDAGGTPYDPSFPDDGTGASTAAGSPAPGHTRAGLGRGGGGTYGFHELGDAHAIAETARLRSTVPDRGVSVPLQYFRTEN